MLRLLEVLIFFFGIMVLVTQIIIPILKGTVLFPFFYTKQNDLEKQLTEAVQHVEDVKLQESINNTLKEGK